MILKYRGIALPKNSVVLNITKRATYGDRNQRLSTIEQWNINGTLRVPEGSTTAAARSYLTREANRIKAIFSRDGGDLGLYLDNGSTLTTHFLRSSNTLSGTKIIQPPSFPPGAAVYATRLPFTVQIEAETLDNQSQLVSYEESITMTGNGGPIVDYLPVVEGPWEAQRTHTNSLVEATQSGRAVGYSGYIAPPPPMWPHALINPAQSVTFTTPRFNGRTYTHYEVSWNYVFRSNRPLAGGIPRSR